VLQIARDVFAQRLICAKDRQTSSRSSSLIRNVSLKSKVKAMKFCKGVEY